MYHEQIILQGKFECTVTHRSINFVAVLHKRDINAAQCLLTTHTT